MKTHFALLIISVMAAGLLACDKNSNGDPQDAVSPKQIELPPQGLQVIERSNEFGIELFVRTAAGEQKDNLMLSPLSASAALTMLLNGSAGDTFDQIRDMLGYGDEMDIEAINQVYKSLVGQLLDADPKVTLAIANAVFYRDDFQVKPPFIESMDEDFDAHIEALDFSLPPAIEVINSWASDNTNGKIPEVINDISADMVMFLMNALYFKGDWTYQFDKELTQEAPFYLDEGSHIDVPTMTGNVNTRRYYGEGLRAVELPYGRTNFSMVVIVPDGSLKEFYNEFTPDVWRSVTKGLDVDEEFTETSVMMPRFGFEYDTYLNNQLRSLGMVDAFEPYLADLSGISDWDIFVSFVKQNTFVEVGEEGTEAAAVTTIGIDVTSVDPDSPPRFHVDQPFVFAIRERTTNTLLFIGSVSRP